MPKFSANLGFLWPDRPLLDRIDAAAAAGFRAVELHWPFNVPAQEIGNACARHGLALLGLNTPPGDRAKREFGLAALPGREQEFRDAFRLSADYARAAGAGYVHVMAGVAEDRNTARRTLFANLSDAAREAPDLMLILEAINIHDCPGYLYSRQDEVREVIETLALPNLRMMLDCYHAGRMGEDVVPTLERCMAFIGHVQIAAVPDRGEPDAGSLDYRQVFAALDRLGYRGWIGCEYRPRGETTAGLGWAEKLGVSLGGD